MEVYLLIPFNKKQNASPGTTKLVQSHKNSVAAILRMQKVYLLEVIFCNGFRTLTNVRGYNVHKHREELEHRPNKKQESLTTLFDI